MAKRSRKETLYQMYEQMLRHTLGREDTFRFHCTGCGACCKHREDILVTPFDLNRMAHYLGMEMREVFREYCVWYTGPSSKLPVVTVRMLGPEQICPFLENTRCRIHEAKPTVCALFPLGRLGSDEDDSIRYILQKVSCGTEDEVHTVQDWLVGFGLEESETWFREWQKVIMPMAKRMREFAEKSPEEWMEITEAHLLGTLYLNYENDRDFMEQFHGNAEIANMVLDMTEAVMSEEGNGSEGS